MEQFTEKTVVYASFFERVPAGFEISPDSSPAWEPLRQLVPLLHRLPDNSGGRLNVLPEVCIRGDGPLSVADDVEIWPGVTLVRPVWIGRNSKLLPGAFVRSSWIGEGCVVGHCVEVARSILMGQVAIPHQSIILDSILGFNVNVAGGARFANLPLSFFKGETKGQGIRIRLPSGDKLDTGLTKLGAILGDDVVTPVNLTVNPGTLVGRRAIIYPRNGVSLDGVWAQEAKIKPKQILK